MRCHLALPALLLLTPTLTANDSDIDLATFDRRIKPADRAHWAYQPVKNPVPPKVKDTSWVRHPLDAFILAKLEEKGLKPAPPAEPRALLRRLHLDVTGLPPTPEEVEAFVKSCATRAGREAAVAKVVDDLLARPTHGERWARHWLDLVRYAETGGYERDAARPNVWRYRDYVIRALNDDKPYDRFILEQLAGDELEDASAETMIATTFLRLGPWDDEPADPKEDRFDQLDDIVNVTSQTFLGLTLSCARCHNHKFEALTLHDYYRMVAVFNPLQRPTRGRTELDVLAGSRAEIAAHQRRGQALAVLARGAGNSFPGTSLPGVLGFMAAGEALRSSELPRAYTWRDTAKPPETHLLVRGKATRPGPKVEPGMPAVLAREQPKFLPLAGQTSRRRLSLAQWIASPNNPLTARVWVNRVWHYHFGAGLVRSPSDFGVAGQRPTHPELLDWLASWFMENGWSTRKLHRLILTSAVYQQASTPKGALDPDNTLLSRFPRRRLEIEPLRDAMLFVSGRLNAKMFGPWMYPEVPKEALEGSSDPKLIWRPFEENEASRRTIYAHIKRSFVVPLLEVFDLCDTVRPADKRLVTTVAPQALALFNGSFTQRLAKQFAARLQSEVGDDRARQIERAFVLALCRPPTESESRRMSDFLEAEQRQLQKEQPGLPSPVARRALEQLCRVIFNLNEFAYPD